jgi:hypothetical protein
MRMMRTKTHNGGGGGGGGDEEEKEEEEEATHCTYLPLQYGPLFAQIEF